jgi:hypothetical protein
MGLMAAVEEDITGNESLTESFWWYGDEDRVDFKPNGSVSNYSHPFDPLCS